MRFILLVLPILTTVLLSAQDTTYYEITDKKTALFNDCHHYEISTRNDADTVEFTDRGFYKSGKQKSLSHYNKKGKRIYEGTTTDWHENGQIKWIINYKNGEFDGDLISYWESGQLKRQSRFQNDSLVEGVCWDLEGHEVDFYDFETMPVFPGGNAEFYVWLGQNMEYPELAQDARIRGKVYVNFAIDSTGEVKDVRILRGIGGGCDEEAIRVMNLCPNWIPGKQDGNNVRVSFNLPINFSKPDRRTKKKKKN